MSDQQQIVDLVAQMESAPAEAPTPTPTPDVAASEGATQAPETTESPAAEIEAAAAADPVLERSWQATIAKEKKLLQLQQDLKSQKDALGAAPAAVAPGIDMEKLRSDPLGTLKQHGVHFEDLAKRVLNDGRVSPEETMRRQTGKANDRIEHLEKTIAEMQKQSTEHQHARMVTEYQAGVTQALADPEFELLRAYPDSEALVFNLASTHANQNGEVLTPVDAARRIQGEIREQLTTLSTNDAVRKLLGLQEAPTSSQVSQTQSTAGQTPTTLTNALAATPASEVPSLDGLSEYQQLIEAAKLIPDAAG